MDTYYYDDRYFSSNTTTIEHHQNGQHDLRKYAMGSFNTFLVVTSSLLTIIGSILIITTYNAYKNIQTPIRHIIVCISISDLMCVCANLTGVFMMPERTDIAGHDIKCILQSFIGTTFVLSSFLWTIILALSLYIWLVLYKPEKIKELIHPWFHLFCWLVPLALNVVALCLKKLGNSGDVTSSGWCWIQTVSLKEHARRDAIIWMFIDGKGLEILTYIILLIFYLLIKCHLQAQIKKSSRSDSKAYLSKRTIEAARSADKKLLIVPIILIFLRIWGTIRFMFFVFQIYPKYELHKILISLQAIGDNLQGFTNCVLFCFCTKSVNMRIKKSVIVFQRSFLSKRREPVNMQGFAEREPLIK